MGKLILLLLGLLIAYAVLQSYRKKVGGGRRPPAGKDSEDMVRCEYCGVHLPRSESLLTSGKFYCCREHQPQSQKAD